VLSVGLQLSGSGLEFATAVTGLVEKLARGAQKIVNLGEAGAKLILLELQQTFAGLPGIALGGVVGSLGFAFKIFGFRSFQ
jgi:hypothetical protein